MEIIYNQTLLQFFKPEGSFITLLAFESIVFIVDSTVDGSDDVDIGVDWFVFVFESEFVDVIVVIVIVDTAVDEDCIDAELLGSAVIIVVVVVVVVGGTVVALLGQLWLGLTEQAAIVGAQPPAPHNTQPAAQHSFSKPWNGWHVAGITAVVVALVVVVAVGVVVFVVVDIVVVVVEVIALLHWAFRHSDEPGRRHFADEPSTAEVQYEQPLEQHWLCANDGEHCVSGGTGIGVADKSMQI